MRYKKESISTFLRARLFFFSSNHVGGIEFPFTGFLPSRTHSIFADRACSLLPQPRIYTVAVELQKKWSILSLNYFVIEAYTGSNINNLKIETSSELIITSLNLSIKKF